MAGDNKKKLGVIALAAIVVSAMVGGGIFSLPQNMAQDAALMAVIVAWIITGVGMYFIANTFRVLSDARPDATTGIYAYARLGFGRFAGFQMAWSYWLSNIFGNVGYAVLLMDAMDYFFPGVFTGGNNIWSIIGGSIMIWTMNFLVLRGTQQAASINTIGTIAKLVPILLFIIIMAFMFRWSNFSQDVMGQFNDPAHGFKPLGGLMEQTKSTMLVTLWAFIGIEGAIVVSGRAKSARAVGKATLLGFLASLTIYALLSILPFGRMTQPELAGLANPSTAPLLSDVVGSWGGWVMNLGVIIALMTSWLAFTIMIAQIPYAAAMDNTFPQIFRRENGAGTPNISLIVTSSLMQISMIVVFFASNAWNTMLSVTGVMILPPYLACTAYLWKLCAKKEYPKGLPVKFGFAFFCGVAGTVYALWMIYAAGLEYMMMAFIFLAIGIPFYIWARKDAMKANPDEEKVIFNKYEIWGASAVVIVALAALTTFAVEQIRADEATAAAKIHHAGTAKVRGKKEVKRVVTPDKDKKLDEAKAQAKTTVDAVVNN